MLSFVLESTVFLGCSYGFYIFFLSRGRSFVFIRFYFLLALLISVIIPFVDIELGRNLPVAGSFSDEGIYALIPLVGEEVLIENRPVLNIKIVLILIYFTGVGFMLLRFLLNLIRLTRNIRHGKQLEGICGRLILTEEAHLPYSFFRNIFITRSIYERGEEVENLLLHESAHCRQLHSADILLVEFLKAFLWFNPFVWLTAEAIRLNHEYMADEKVLESQNKHSYQLLLINLDLANQCITLASDFNFSLTKKRLVMMNKKDKGKTIVIGKYMAIPVFLVLAVILTFCEGENPADSDPYHSMEFYANDWWRPILERHDITPSAYNNYEFIFEMGSTNSINENNVVTLEDAFFLLRTDGNSYAILRSPLATHNLETNIISGVEGILNTYDLHQEEPESLNNFEMKNFRLQMVKNGVDMSADYMEWGPAEDKTILKGNVSFAARDSLVVNTDQARSEK